MAQINWNPKWQLNPPAKIHFNRDGTVTLRGPVGDVMFPEDYRNFMLKSEGAALRDKGSFFLAHFADGTAIFEIEWLGSLRSVGGMTWDYYIYPEADRHKLPPGFVGIGYAEPAPDGVDVVLNVDMASEDYGKVYAWVRTNDPWMIGDNTRGLGFVANSFTEFMNNLTDRKNL